MRTLLLSVCLKKNVNLSTGLLVIGKKILRVTIDEMQKFNLANVAVNG